MDRDNRDTELLGLAVTLQIAKPNHWCAFACLLNR
jgi:hypothetical protein